MRPEQTSVPPIGSTQYILTPFKYSGLAGAGLGPITSSHANLLCDLKQMSLPLWTSVLSSVSLSCVLSVSWSPHRFCLISWDSWRKAREQGLGLQPEQQSPMCFLALHLCVMPHLSKVFWVFKKVSKPLVRSKALSRANIFKSLMDHPSCRQTWIIDQEVTPGPAAFSRQLCAFPCLAFLPLPCSSFPLCSAMIPPVQSAQSPGCFLWSPRSWKTHSSLLRMLPDFCYTSVTFTFGVIYQNVLYTLPNHKS